MDDDRLTLLEGPTPHGFVRRVVVLPAHGGRSYVAAEWHDAVVVVGRGVVDLHCRAGGLHRARRGDVVWFDGLPIRRLHNPGDSPAVLVAVRRRGRPAS